ncbi:MAG: undecaprenyl-diphosphate phosphatase [Salinivirgaceae bacterium]|nr:undecaprenyl-diphosphate phosphatase [Salinivirgaceae bacterium]MDD4746103.1 undecaprenyl-diphosphate phosphatase [Salinivirgaceae bacterium]
MSPLESFILGIIQGITEFLPISSSGHLKIGEAILNTPVKDNLLFTIVVHGATVLSTIVVFRKDLWEIFTGLFQFKWNEPTKFSLKIILSMIPIAIVGLFFKDNVESLFESINLTGIGFMLILTSILLFFAWRYKGGEKKVGYGQAIIIGLAQVIAIVPGISRSGATIGTALLLKVDKAKAARFSFLMVIVPILGENILDLTKGTFAMSLIPINSLIVGFFAAFIAGLFACKVMIKIVSQGKLHYFAIYCAIVGTLAVIFHEFIM